MGVNGECSVLLYCIENELDLWPICSKPVASRIFDFLSMIHHLKEKHIVFTMTLKLSFYIVTEIIN